MSVIFNAFKCMGFSPMFIKKKDRFCIILLK